MAKQIAYLTIYNGIDGLSKSVITHASFDEEELNEMYNTSKNKNWLTKKEIIVDVEPATRLALGKLDALDKLLLKL